MSVASFPSESTLANVPDRAAEIRRNMSEIRMAMLRHADRVADQAQKAADWRSYVPSNPWIWAGAAVVVGYFLIPRKRAQATVDRKQVEHAVQDAVRQTATETAAQNQPTKTKVLLGLLLPVVQSMALRAAVSVWQNMMMPGGSQVPTDTAPATPLRPKQPR